MFAFYVITKKNVRIYSSEQMMKDFIKETKEDVIDFGRKKFQGYKEEVIKIGEEPDWETIKEHLVSKYKEYYPNKILDKQKFLAELDAFKSFYRDQNWCRKSKGKLVPVQNWKSASTRWFSKSFSRLGQYQKNVDNKIAGWM